jgi:ABC-type bacteriocin/lantibiotic exporter with double-glycine peptidase domain
MIPENAIKVHVRNVGQQKNHTCGAAALRAVLLYYGVKITEYQVEKLAKTTEKGTNIPGSLHGRNWLRRQTLLLSKPQPRKRIPRTYQNQ